MRIEHGYPGRWDTRLEALPYRRLKRSTGSDPKRQRRRLRRTLKPPHFRPCWTFQRPVLRTGGHQRARTLTPLALKFSYGCSFALRPLHR